MLTQPKTPGVYISEPNSFPPSIVGVDTAVPAFIGYTDTASQNRKDVTLTPIRINSLAEYIQIFGGPYQEQYYLADGKPAENSDDKSLGEILLYGSKSYFVVEKGSITFNLYNSMCLFYANGGGQCYVVSCGDYKGGKPDYKKLKDGLDAIANLVGPTMLVIPDAVLLDKATHGNLANDMIGQCGAKQDRVAILDVWNDDLEVQARKETPKVATTIDEFRDRVGKSPDYRRYGMAYYPYLQTSIVQPSDISIANFTEDADKLKAVLKTAVETLYPRGANDTGEGTQSDRAAALFKNYIDKIGKDATPATTPATPAVPHEQITQALNANIPAFGDLLKLVADSQNVLPPSAAMAGIYTANDAARGVWNAPANVGIAMVVKPIVDISSDDQQDMNVPTEGKAVNAIRTFPGRGTLVWGARTLDGNSNDWRYIQVRRAMIYIEQSIKTALNAFVFAPNTAQTWVTVASMTESFLHGVWSAGGLMGSSPDQAYNVQVGLGSTMTPDDILNGNMIVQVVLQMIHPAEFIQLTFKQQMQGGA